MPQQLQPVEETASFQTAPVTPTPIAQTVSQPSRRYDAQAVQQIIALAEQLQTSYRETSSTEEVEALGRQIGVEPEFVRRALAQMETPAKTVAPPDTFHQERVVGVAIRPFTRRQRAQAVVPAALYLLAMPFTFAWFLNFDSRAGFFFLLLPALMALYVGVKGKSKRVGALSGTLLALASIFSLMGNTAYHHGSQPTLNEFIGILVLWVGSGITLGVGGAALWQFINELPRRKRFRVRVTVETKETHGKPNGEWV